MMMMIMMMMMMMMLMMMLMMMMMMMMKLMMMMMMMMMMIPCKSAPAEGPPSVIEWYQMKGTDVEKLFTTYGYLLCKFLNSPF